MSDPITIDEALGPLPESPLRERIKAVLEMCATGAVAAEREACAKIAEELVPDFEPIPCPDGDPTCLVAHARNIKRHRSWREIAAAIRARAKTEGSE